MLTSKLGWEPFTSEPVITDTWESIYNTYVWYLVCACEVIKVILPVKARNSISFRNS